MRNIAAVLALLIASSVATSTASAKPHRKAHKAIHETAWMRDCIHERTGPDGGIPMVEARQLCREEQPEDEVAAAKRILAIARSNQRVAKAKARADKAIEACELAVSVSCEDVTERAVDGGECSDETLRANGAFAICH